MAVVSRSKRFPGIAAGICGVMAVFSTPAAEEFDRGEALYENHCRECHESWAHTRDGRHVTTVNGLRGRVAAWSIHTNLQWSQEEIDDVTDYLNQQFYQFTNKE